jgi:hypothetical protein
MLNEERGRLTIVMISHWLFLLYVEVVKVVKLGALNFAHIDMQSSMYNVNFILCFVICGLPQVK